MQLSGLHATDKTPMYEMPLTFLFGGRVLRLERAFSVSGFWVFGIWSSAVCPEILSARTASQQPKYIVMLAY